MSPVSPVSPVNPASASAPGTRAPWRAVIVDDQALLVSAFEMLLSSQPDLEVVGTAVDGAAAPEVAQALQAQAVPTVVALISGQPVPMFQGPVAEDQLRAVVDQLLEVAAANGVSGTIAVDAAVSTDAQAEPEETEVERAAREAIEAGDFAAAEEVYTHAIAQNPGDDDLKVARNQVRLMARMDGQDPHQLLAAADAAPADLEAALAGADAALALGDVNAALGRALEAVRTHQGEERESARLRLLELFEIIGATSPEVAQARRRLASLLY